LCCGTFLLIGECVLFLVLGLVFFSIPSREFGLGERLRNDQFCVERDANHNTID